MEIVDVNKLFLAATHTHTAPELLQERYDEKDYGVQIQARSPAPQTMLIQLATSGRQHAYYLPTPRAVAAGGYSAEATHNIVGPEGGQVLVDRTVEEINKLFNVPSSER